MRKKPLLKSDSQPTVKSVQRQFKIWRGNRKGRKAIPERLWSAALRLTEEMSINQVAHALGLNHTALSARVSKSARRKRSSGKTSRRSAQGQRFIELDCNPWVSPVAGAVCEVELEESDGRKLRLRGVHPGELIESIRSLWAPVQ